MSPIPLRYLSRKRKSEQKKHGDFLISYEIETASCKHANVHRQFESNNALNNEQFEN